MQEPARKEDHRLARLTKIIHLAMPEATWKLAAAVSAGKRVGEGMMRIWAWVFVGVCALGLGACNRRDGDAAERKVGKTAHEIAMESERAAKKAGREIGHAAREAREGWKEADKGKDKK